jgi:hypothetical protein
MGFSSSIQFRDKESVINAFDARGIDAWSISCGKQFMFKGIGKEEFANMIEILSQADSTATYTVQVYEDVEDEKKIKNTTACDGSFNFKFNEEIRQAYGMIRDHIGGTGSANEIVSKLNALEARLNESENMEIEENDNSLGIVGKILSHPAIAPVAPKLVEGLLGLISGNNPVNAIAGQPLAVNHETDEDKIVSELKKHDPKLNRHLAKLLALAEQDPATFTNIVNSFD